jgi:hypothetical protein
LKPEQPMATAPVAGNLEHAFAQASRVCIPSTQAFPKRPCSQCMAFPS